MKIGIIGGGSIGLLFAHYLNKHHDVTIYVRSNEQVEMINSQGLIFEKDKVSLKEKVKSQVFSCWTGEEDLTIIAVKQYQLHSVLRGIKEAKLNDFCSFLFIQNGMGHLKWLNEIEAANIFVGSVEHGAFKVNANHVIHTGNGKTRVALFKGNNLTKLTRLAQPSIEEFPFVIEEDYYEMLIQKLIINAVINPLTALLSVPNGELIENPHYYQVFKQIFHEVSTILDISEKDKIFRQLEEVCRKTAANRSSMLKDIDENRQTEVDAILGYVLEKGKEKAINTPLTNSFYYLIKGKEYAKGVI